MHIAAELVVIRVTAAAAIESCPAVPAVRLAVDMSLGEVGLHFTVKCAVVHVAHFIVCLTDKLMTWVDVAVRCDCHVLIAAAAATQTLDRTGALIQIQHEVEEVELLAGCLIVQNLLHQPFIFLKNTGQVCLGNCVRFFRISDNRFHRDLVEACVQQSEHIIGEVQIVLGVSTADVVFLFPTLIYQLLVHGNDLVIGALAVYAGTHAVIDFFSAVDRQYHVGHFPIDEVDLVIGEQHAVGSNGEPELLVIDRLL